jgi:3'(2'), 5'-bisphosphate nucleotidase
MNLMELTNSLIPSVIKAGKIIMEIYQGDITKKIKTDGSPVTEADNAAERVILNELHRLVPEILVISEESPENHSRISKEKFFLVDPLDGTKEFLKRDGKGSFTVNIGLIENHIPIMGIVYAPALGRLFFGAQSFGAWEVFNGIKTKLSIGNAKTESLVAVASVSHSQILPRCSGPSRCLSPFWTHHGVGHCGRRRYSKGRRR